jgi:hypothetical protein
MISTVEKVSGEVKKMKLAFDHKQMLIDENLI